MTRAEIPELEELYWMREVRNTVIGCVGATVASLMIWALLWLSLHR